MPRFEGNSEWIAYIKSLSHAKLKTLARKLMKETKKAGALDLTKSHEELIKDISTKFSYQKMGNIIDVIVQIPADAIPKTSKKEVKKKIIENVNVARKEKGMEPYKTPRKPRTKKEMTEPSESPEKTTTKEKTPRKTTEKMVADFDKAGTTRQYPVMAPSSKDFPNEATRAKVWTVMKQITKIYNELSQNEDNKPKTKSLMEKRSKAVTELQKLVKNTKLANRLHASSEGIDVEGSESLGLLKIDDYM